MLEEVLTQWEAKMTSAKAETKDQRSVFRELSRGDWFSARGSFWMKLDPEHSGGHHAIGLVSARFFVYDSRRDGDIQQMEVVRLDKAF